jgi:hypothetical protein
MKKITIFNNDKHHYFELEDKVYVMFLAAVEHLELADDEHLIELLDYYNLISNYTEIELKLLELDSSNVNTEIVKTR